MVFPATEKDYTYEIIKRLIDITSSLILLIVFSPIILLVTISILLDSSGPIFADTPERVGKDGKPFKMYKFRSMVQNAHNILRNDPEFANLFNEYKKGSYKL